ncbi:MAG: CoA-transferase, partial [Bacteroidota bacterium]
KDGQPKIVKQCQFPLTGKAVVKRIYTDLAILEVTENGLLVKRMAPGISFDYLQEKTDGKLIMP